jgi:glutathionyl-hydroquinone reductase
MTLERAARERGGERRFAFGRELEADGRWVRQESVFRRRVTADQGSSLPAGAGRYHLYVCLCDPWSHRSVIARRLLGLENAIGISYLDPYRDHRGWAFTGGDFVDDVNGFSFLAEAYEATQPGYDARFSVPVLWDKDTRQIVSNESGEIMRMLETEFEALATRDADLYPAPLREEIDALNETIYDNVNNGVYTAGFTTRQDIYEQAFEKLFATLAQLEERLSSSRYLTGDAPTEADWRLFVSLVRFDAVYHTLFKCNRRRIVDYPNLWGYTRDLYQQPLIAETVAMDQIKSHYYTTHEKVNPSRIVPLGPALDFFVPHGRG